MLIGPSGCGKTSVLRLMLGLIAPDSGNVRFGGAELEETALGVARRRMGYVVQDGGLFPHLTALGNVSLMARHLAWAPDRIRGRTSSCACLRGCSNAIRPSSPGARSSASRSCAP